MVLFFLVIKIDSIANINVFSISSKFIRTICLILFQILFNFHAKRVFSFNM